MDFSPLELTLTDPRHPFHVHHMEMALAEAGRAFDEDEVPIGAVIVSYEHGVIAQAHNQREQLNDHEWDDDSSAHCPECGFNGKLKAFRKPVNLPPDPDNLNDDRSAWAGSALAMFIQVTGTDEEDALGDLLADLMHWCDRNNYDFEAALIRARGHYEAETLGEPPA